MWNALRSLGRGALILLLAGALGGAAALPSGSRVCQVAGAGARVWPEILVQQGADLADYRATLAQSRDAVRQMFEQEFLWILKELAQQGGQPEQMIEPVLSAVLAFDELHERHKAAAAEGMPVYLEVGLRSALGQLYAVNRIPRERRRLEFVHQSLVERLKTARTALLAEGSVEERQLEVLRQVVDTVDWVAYAILNADGARHEINLTLEHVRSGTICDFAAGGSLPEVVYGVAEQVFQDFQAVAYPPVRNPNEHLTWIPPAVGAPVASPARARAYCANQGDGVRLPYSMELAVASQVGADGVSYVPGGIPRLESGPWIVADRLYRDEQYFYHVVQPGAADNHPLGPLRTAAGLGRLEGRYWCVQGTPADEVARVQRLYDTYRHVQRVDPDSMALGAAEYLLVEYGALAARPQSAGAFATPEAAWAALQRVACELQGTAGSQDVEAGVAELEGRLLARYCALGDPAVDGYN